MKRECINILSFFIIIFTLQLFEVSAQNSNKVLVTYFTMPQTVGIDGSRSASCIVEEGKVYGTVECVDTQIVEATGGVTF